MIIREKFSEWVKKHIINRNLEVTQISNLLINMDPDIAAAFQASTAVSSK